jgi:DNA processing protein
MAVSERGALLALLRTSGRSWAQVTDEVESVGSALQVLRDGVGGQLSLLPADNDADTAAEMVEQEIAAWEQQGMRFLSVLDADYPAQLLTVHQRPPFLITRGTPSAADARGVAVVGTRNATDRGLRQARQLATELTDAGVPVVSGLAAGIDTAALSAALSAGGRAVAVIGTGLRRSYPKENAGLQQRIGEAGLVISQFLPDAPPTKTTFPMRNAVMSGYSAATVVVEAPNRSGARMQARLALEHGRQVFLLDTLLVNDWARDYAERPNTVVVRDVSDVIQHLQPALANDQELVWA